MEVSREVEDDVFFADLNKQISLLLMDEDDLVLQCPSVPPQAFPRAIYQASAAQPSFSYEQACKRDSKGTGVFIPQSSHVRRKNRHGRSFNSANKKLQRHSDNSKGLPRTSIKP